MVRKRAPEGRIPPLAVLAKETGEDLNSLANARGALESKTQIVHSNEPRRHLGELSAEHGLVPDHQAVLVGTDLSPPDPVRSGQENLMRSPGLGNLLVG